MDFFLKINKKFKGKRYCPVFSKLVKQFDLLGLLNDAKIEKMCNDLSFINKSLNKAYIIIFKKKLSMKDAISKISQMKDNEDNNFIDSDSAEKIYNKFKLLEKSGMKGGTYDNSTPNTTIYPDTKTDMSNRGIDNDDEHLMTNIPHVKESISKNTLNILKSKLTGDDKKIVNESFDMMEVLLICLSLIPVTGWTFDFPLFIYSLSQKKYNLAMITVLNWYIWGFFLIFGVNVNMGPVMKSSYLGNNENFVKKSLLYPEKQPKAVLNPYDQVKVKKIDGVPYLIDKNGNAFSAEIKSPNVMGIVVNKDGKDTLIRKFDNDYQIEYNKQNKKK